MWLVWKIIIGLSLLMGESLAGKDENNMVNQIDLYMKKLTELGRFSGSILVAKDGKILISKGYGQANYELDVPCAPETKFRIGSITKSFTAMAIMQLQEKELLSVNDPISKYIPDYPRGNEITIHHLLTHTSGIQSYTGFPDFSENNIIPTTLDKIILSFKDKPLEFEPGSTYKYNNSGYALLTHVIEKVSGKSYEEFVKDSILSPIGMSDTGVDTHNQILKNRAAGYSIDSAHKIINDNYTSMSWPLGAGVLYSTVEDLWKLDRALHDGTILKQSSCSIMHTPNKDNYCYGWVSDKICDKPAFWHNGGIHGFRSDFMRFIDDNVCIVVLSNFSFSMPEQVAKDLAAIIFGCQYKFPKEYTEITLDSKIYTDYIGEYELNPEFHLTVTTENNRWYVQATNQPKFEIYADDIDSFFLKVIDAQIKFMRDAQNKVIELVIEQEGIGDKNVAKKINN